jgi:hypothetical protein
MAEAPGYDFGRSYTPTDPYGQTGYGPFDMFRKMAGGGGLFSFPGMQGGSLNSPALDVFTQNSRIQADKNFEDMVRHGAQMQDRQTASMMASVLSGQRLGGQPVTAEQMQGLTTLAGQLNSVIMTPLAMSIPSARAGLDIMAGGASGANSAYALGLANKQLMDPLLAMPNMSSASGIPVHAAFHNQLFGGGQISQQMQLGGLTSADLPSLIGPLAQRGAFSNTLLEQQMRDNPYIRSAIHSGAYGSAADLGAMGIESGNFEKIIGWKKGVDDIDTATRGAFDGAAFDTIKGQGITSGAFDRVAKSGLRKADVEAIVKHDMSGEDARRILGSGLSTEELAYARHAGLKSGDIQALTKAGVSDADLELISMNGATADFMTSDDDYISKRTGGRIDAAAAKRIRGYKLSAAQQDQLATARLSGDALVKLRDGAISEADQDKLRGGYITQDSMERIAGGTLSKAEIDQLKASGLTTQGIAAISQGGMSMSELERIKKTGLTAHDRDRMTEQALSSGDPDGQAALFDSVGKRMARVAADAAAAHNAVKALYDPKLIKSTEEVVQAVEEFTGLYNQQLSGKQIANVVRRSQSALSDFGYDFRALSERQGFAAEIVHASGFAQGMTPLIALQAAEHTSGLLRGGAFAGTQGYGVLNAAQMDEFKMKQDTAVTASREMKMMAAIIMNTDSVGMDRVDSSAHGQRVSKIIRNLKAGVATGDDEYNNMSPEEQASFVSKGFSNDPEMLGRMMRDSTNAFSTAQTIAEQGLTANAQHLLRAAHKQSTSLSATSTALDGELGAASGDKTVITGMLNDALNSSALSLPHQIAADNDATASIVGAAAIAKLHEVATGTGPEAEQAKQMLAHIKAKGISEEAYGKQMGDRYRKEIEHRTGQPFLNTSMQLGDVATTNAQAAKARGQIQAAITAGLDGSTNNNVSDALIAGVAKYREGGMSLEEIVEGAFKTSIDPEQKKQMTGMLQHIIDQEAELKALPEETGSDVELNKANEVKKNAVKDQKRKLEQMWNDQMKLEAKAAREAAGMAGEAVDGVEGGGTAAGGEATVTTGKGGGVTINNLTLNLGPEHILTIEGQIRNNADRVLPEANAKA